MLKTNVHETNGGVAVHEPVVPEPTAEFYHRLETRVGAFPIPHPIPVPIPLPIFFGARFLIWKQDPSVSEPGLRIAYLPGFILNGPLDARITTILSGTTPIHRNVNGDFIFPAGTPELDSAHTFAVVWQTLRMYERVLGGSNIPWAWNTGGNLDRLTVLPRGFVGANAFYSRGQKSLSFGSFTPSGSTTEVFTCRSLDIVSHECGHAILDGLKPGWLGAGNVPQTGGLHESFGDLTAIFLALSQLDQVEAIIALTKANLHAKNFLAALAEQFGLALGRPMGLRNADNDLKLSEVGTEVHAISQVFTGGIYDILADIFAFEKTRQSGIKDPAQVLLEVGQHVRQLLLQAIRQAPNTGATYADVVNKMLQISASQGDPPIYRTFIRSRFTIREVVVSPTPLTAMARGRVKFEDPAFTDGEDSVELKAAEHASQSGRQDRTGCCGTMQLPEYATMDQKKLAAGGLVTEEDLLAPDYKRLAVAFK